MRKKLRTYSNVAEMIESVEDFWKLKVVDGWRENRYWVSVLGGKTSFIENKETGEWLSYQRGIFKIKTLFPV